MVADLCSARAVVAPDLVYVKTEAGRALLAAHRNGLSVRQRQVLLLCTGKRDAVGLEKVFGHALWPDLQQLMQGLVVCLSSRALPDFLREQDRLHEMAQEAAQAAAQTPGQPLRPEPSFDSTLIPLNFAETRSANQSGFENTRRGSATSPLQSARVGAAWLLIELGGPEALQLRRDYAGVSKEADVLLFAARAIGMAERKWGHERALERACRVGEPLDKDQRSQLLVALEAYAGEALRLALYECWLSDTECGHC